MKTRTEWLADQVSDLASHRFTFPIALAIWWWEGWSFVDGFQIVLMFALLNVQARENRGLQIKTDTLIKHSDSPNDLIGLERKGAAEIAQRGSSC